jgi:hypothetical protein
MKVIYYVFVFNAMQEPQWLSATLWAVTLHNIFFDGRTKLAHAVEPSGMLAAFPNAKANGQG